MKKIILSILLFSAIPAFSQIVNIESERFTTDTTGWAGSFQMGFTMGKQDVKFFALNTTVHLQYKTKKNLYLILGSLDLVKSQNEQLVNDGFFHFRYNYKIRDWLRWEAFTQLQYNKLTGIGLRFLVGTGPRFKAVDVKKFKLYLGTLYMFEYEENVDRTQRLVEGRFDGYLSFSFHPIKNIEFISTTYYQPKFEDTKDFRIATDNALNFKVYKHISLGIVFALNYDSRPPSGFTNLTYNWQNQIKVDF